MEALKEKITPEEAIDLGAVDNDFYAHFFFPKTARQESPVFHQWMDDLLDNPQNRYVSFSIFRDGAKTTKVRLFLSKRIGYGISHTILVVGKSQDHAKRSVKWVMKQVEYNKLWAQTFGLRKGSKWTPEECEIFHGTDEYPITILAVGITGSIRGINIDDWRPDLIVLDDPCDEENTATPEARQKMEDLVFGALQKSLSPASESPDATMVLMQTPLIKGDLIDVTIDDDEWASLKISCFLANGKSSWEARYPTEVLQKDKEAHIKRNQLSLWMREKEVTIISRELAAFRSEWLKPYVVVPDGGLVFIGIDPTPPPKDTASQAIAVNKKLDDAVIIVIKYHGGNIYLLDYYITKSPDPGEFLTNFFRLAFIYNPYMVGIETTMHQRTLKWELDRAMLKNQKFYTVIPVEDKRNKEVRILQTVSRYASNGLIYVKPEHTEFIDQFSVYQAMVPRQRDDILDAFTIALDLINPALEGVTLEGEFTEYEEDIPELEDWRSAP